VEEIHLFLILHQTRCSL